jgi:hypothetical protein
MQPAVQQPAISEPTLGQLRNRIAVLFAHKAFRPDAPLSSVLTTEELRLLAQRAENP